MAVKIIGNIFYNIKIRHLHVLCWTRLNQLRLSENFGSTFKPATLIFYRVLVFLRNGDWKMFYIYLNMIFTRLYRGASNRFCPMPSFLSHLIRKTFSTIHRHMAINSSCIFFLEWDSGKKQPFDTVITH